MFLNEIFGRRTDNRHYIIIAGNDIRTCILMS